MTLNVAEKINALDLQLVNTCKHIKVLNALAWPVKAAKKFVDDWHRGQPTLPDVPLEIGRYKKHIKQLGEVMKACDREDPLQNFLYRTARSYLTAANMLQFAGTPAFTELSSEIYGTPRDRIWTTSITNLEAAEHFISSTEGFMRACPTHAESLCLMAEHVKEELQKPITSFFKNHEVRVVIDPELASKAAAGASQIRIRNFTCFSPMDIPQLLHHEAFVHTLTMINGREQTNLKCLSLGAPRTTRTQEGLALFAELITNSIDIARLRRIALRVKAIDLAMQGANFIEVFQFFLNNNQDETESFQSAARIFRGGDVKGGVAFTKDSVYLEGLIYIHTFLHKAIQSGKVNYPYYLFTGRLTFADVVELEPYFESGFIAKPIYLPSWVVNRECLTAFLSYSIFSNGIDLESVTLNDFSANPRMLD